MTTQELAGLLAIPATDASYLDVMTDAERQQLGVLIEATRESHKAEVLQSVDDTADQLPRILRGQFRKLFK